MNKSFSTGFIAIVGRPNVGKSTLTNFLVGSKVSIVSKKSQTTQCCINAILTDKDRQFIFVDTPGYQDKFSNSINWKINNAVMQTLSDTNIIIHVIEAGKWLKGDANLLNLLPVNRKTILAINKIDLVKNRDELFPFVEKVMSLYPYTAVVPISALRNYQIDHLLNELSIYLPVGNHIFDKTMITDKPKNFRICELVREKILYFINNEVPYSCKVFIELLKEYDHIIYISVCILVKRSTHKPILLGIRGQRIKRISTEARKDISKLLNKSTYLDIYVKLDKKN